jgi:enediyne biosynthesis protein E7
MTGEPRRIPPGPIEKYTSSEDLLVWLGERFQRYGDIYKASIYGTDAYVLTGPQYVEHVLLRNWQNYPKGQAIKRIALLLGNGLMVSKGEFWTRQRRMIQPAFNRSALGGLLGMITAANLGLLEKWERSANAKASVNVTRDISLMILDIVLKSIFGDDYEEVEPQFRVVSEEASRNLEFAVLFTSLGTTILTVAERRRREGRVSGDFLGLMMQARDRESGLGMSDAQLVKEIMTLIVAGHETTASTLNWVWYLLSQNSKAEAKLSGELDALFTNPISGVDDLKQFAYTRRVIEEALRLYPPGWLMTRRAIKDDQIGDYFVPAGTEIYISPFYIQRHPGLWEVPNTFDPDRFESDEIPEYRSLAMLPFSVGPRNCIGEHLARIEMQIHVMMIAKRLRLRYVETGAPVLAAGVNLLSVHDFIMTPELKETPGTAA